MTLLGDRHGRVFPYLRLSLLDACQYRCGYCLPDGYRAGPERPQFLQIDEIGRLVRAFAGLGMHKLRLTGGEPSLRHDLTDIIALASATPGLHTVALTTNGSLLDRRIGAWHRAGLTALNVSVDALDRDLFQRITGRDELPQVLAGVEQALGLGLASVKLNAVLLRDLNDAALPQWLDYVRERALTVRFIELMQTGTNHGYFRRHHLRADALQQQLLDAGWQLQPRAVAAGPACDYAHPDFLGRIGIIAPYAPGFCASCNRLRVTSSGDLRLCLFGNVGIPLRPLLQHDDQQDALMASIARQLGIKALGHGLHAGDTGLIPHLAAIGG